MNKTLKAMAKLFDELGWKYESDPRHPVIHTAVHGENGNWQCVATTGNSEEHLLFLSLFPGKAPEARRLACAELFTRINYDLATGCFEMDFADGAIRFRTAVPVSEGDMAPVALKWLVFTNLSAVDAHFGAIMRVIHAGCSPEEALEKPELLESEEPRFELN